MELEHIRHDVDATLGGACRDSSVLRLSHSRQSGEPQIVAGHSCSAADLVHASLYGHSCLRYVRAFPFVASVPRLMAFGESFVAGGSRKVDDCLADAVFGGVR